MSSKAKEIAVGDNGGFNSNADINKLRERMESQEMRHLSIKAEFEALKQLNEELSIRHEKEIKELKLDLRIAKRDADKWQDHNRYLRDEKRELKEQLTAINTKNNEIQLQMCSKDQQIEQLVQQLKTINDEWNAKLSDQKAIKESFEERIKTLNNETKALREQLSKQFEWKQKFDDSHRRSEQLSKDLERLRSQMQCIQNELTLKNNESENKEKEINKLRKTNKILQDQCLQMDRQAELFKNKSQGVEGTKHKLIDEKDSLKKEIQKLSHQLNTVQNQMKSVEHERDQMRKELQSGRSHFEELVSNERQQIKELEQTLNEVLQKNRLYEDRLREQEDNFYAKDELIANLDSKISICEEELIAIKEEAAHHITTISELKDKNHELTTALQDCMDKIEDFQTRIDSLHHQLDIKEDEMNREKITAQQTIGQHIKLIDFLQKKVESIEKQKKPFISITPTKKFVNSSPHPIYPVEFKDMDRLLAEERTKNRRLVEELNKIKSDSHSHRSQTEVKSSIKSDDLSPTNQSNHLFRKPLFSDNKNKNRNKKPVENHLQTHSTYEQKERSGSRMCHNIPHRFSEITNKLPNNKCVSCAEVIHFGKKAKKCSECNATTHPKCAQRLPNNCGLPVQLMQHLFDSSHEMFDNHHGGGCGGSAEYYHSQPIDDIIEVQQLEPSAPEETFNKYDDNSDSSGNTTDNNESDSGAVMSSALMESPYYLKEIQDICDNKENDGFSFTDSLLEIIERTEKS